VTKRLKLWSRDFFTEYSSDPPGFVCKILRRNSSLHEQFFWLKLHPRFERRNVHGHDYDSVIAVKFFHTMVSVMGLKYGIFCRVIMHTAILWVCVPSLLKTLAMARNNKLFGGDSTFCLYCLWRPSSSSSSDDDDDDDLVHNPLAF